MTDTTKEPEKEKPEYSGLWAYIDNKKRNIGYAYTTKNGNLCIKADKMMDKTQLGRLLTQGLYVFEDKKD